MLIRQFVPLTVLAPLLFTACSEDEGPEQTEDLCAISGPTRILAAPDGWQPDEHESNASVRVVGDRLLYRFGESYVDGDVYLRDACGGEPELVLDQSRGIWSYTVVDGPAGHVLYGDSADHLVYIVDRLDEPGADTPKPLAGLPPLTSSADRPIAVEHHEHGLVWNLPGFVGTGSIYNVAGLGARTSELWTHSGVPDDPAVLLGTDVVRLGHVDEQLWVHTDDGRVRLYDQPTSSETPLVEGARYATAIKFRDRLQVLVQDIGDDQAEQVRLVDPETSESRPVTVNDFTQLSFGRDPEHRAAGTWETLSKGDDTFIGLRGPDGPLIEGYSVATLAPVDLPEHIGIVLIGGPWIHLRLDDPNDMVLAAWDPFTGSVQEWYRGDEEEFNARRYIWLEDRLQYEEEVAKGVRRVSAIDVATGETTVLIPKLGGSSRRLADGRLLTSLPAGEHTDEVTVFDPATQEYTTVVDETREWHYVEDHELVVYTDYTGDEPGVWATPVPPR